MKGKATLQLSDRKECFLEIPLTLDGDREVATIVIDGIFYHLERIKKETLLSQYVIDRDTDYQPQTDVDGYCYILSPFSEQ